MVCAMLALQQRGGIKFGNKIHIAALIKWTVMGKQ